MKAKPAAEARPMPPSENASEMVANAHEALLGARAAMRLPDLELSLLSAFRRRRAETPLSVSDKQTIVDQAAVLFGSIYAHLRFKQQRNTDFRPVEELGRRRDELSRLKDLQFHSQMILLFSQARDPHTLYSAPAPWGEAVAFLPFSLRIWRDGKGGSHLVVTRLLKGFEPPDFAEKSEVLTWNGKPVLEYILNTPGRLPAVEFSTGLARGLATSTVVPLAHCLMPVENVADLEYTSAVTGESRRISIPWSVATGMGQRQDFPDDAFSVSMATGFALDVARLFQHGEAEFGTSQASGAKTVFFAGIPTTGPFEVQFSRGPDVAGVIPSKLLRDRVNPRARFGYLRIRHFGDATSDPAQRVRELAAILGRLNKVAPDGLVIDLRGNPGGNVKAAESMLQLFTDEPVKPIVFHLANTKGVRRTIRRVRTRLGRPSASGQEHASLTNLQRTIGPWIDDYPSWSRSLQWVSSGHSITDEDEANSTGRVYQGPSVLLIDALSYSAADIFAAGYQDHRIGRVIGVDPGSGGGGGNVWYHRDVVRFLPSSVDLPLTELPGEVGMSVAMRRACRRGPVQELEDVGVRPDFVYKPESAAEAVDGFEKLVNLACSFAFDRREFRIAVKARGFRNAEQSFLVLETLNVDRVDVYDVFGRQIASVPARNGKETTIEITESPARTFDQLTIEGFGTVGGWKTPVFTLWEEYILKDDA